MPTTDRLHAWSRTPAAALAAALLVALALFQLTFGLHLVGAGADYWRMPHGDMGQMQAGELAGLREPWSLPLLVARTLTAPEPTSLVYTDSIPWLTALLKLLHLGPVLSLLGTFLLLAWLAQAAAMWALLRACGAERRWTLFVGATLALLMPAWLGRQVGHIALSGHALQIAALALAVHAIRRGMTPRAVAGFVGLGVLAVGVHAYHAPPVTLMFAAALAADVLQRRRGALVRATWGPPLYIGAAAAAAWALGYFVGGNVSGGASALGVFEMNITAPFWPQGSWLAGHRWSGGWFTHTFDPTGSLSFEGHNYLGAGVLTLLAATAVLALRARSAVAMRAAPPPRTVSLARWGPLLAALALLTLYAVGPNAWLGSLRLWSLPLPGAAWMEPVAMFRSHGRFFWTVGYALLALGLVALDRRPERGQRNALLGLVLALQAADLTAHLQGLHERFSRPEALRVPATLDGPAAEGRAYRIFPAYFCTGSWASMAMIRQLSLIAQHRHASTNTAETARAPAGLCARPVPADAQKDAAPGDRRITVVLGSDTGASATTALFSRRTDCRRWDVAWFCGRDLDRLVRTPIVEGADLAPPPHRDADIDVADPAARPHRLSGWSKPEKGGVGVWSQAPRAILRLPAPQGLGPDGVVVVALQALSYQPNGRAPQRAKVSVAGVPVGEWSVGGGLYTTHLARIPARLLGAAPIFDLVLDLPDAAVPDRLEPGSGDYRLLGLGVKSVSIAH